MPTACRIDPSRLSPGSPTHSSLTHSTHTHTHAQVRKAWMKANLLVHPDKVRQRSGDDEQVAIADMIFDALKDAWGQFQQ